MASFAFFGAHAYLSYFAYFSFPWYLPSTAFLATIALAGSVAQLYAAADKYADKKRGSIISLAFLLVGGELWIIRHAAREIRAQQIFAYDGNQRKVGEWLRENAKPADTVFFEPLGYFGFYSGLKTYDYPGLSSREMMQAVRLFGNDWCTLSARTRGRPAWSGGLSL